MPETEDGPGPAAPIDRSEAVRVAQGPDTHAIAAGSQVIGRQPRVLKSGGTFGLFDAHGNLSSDEHAAEGLYDEDTRFLCRLVLTLADAPPLLLGSTVVIGTATLSVDLTNPDLFRDGGGPVVPRESLHLRRDKTLEPGVCREVLRVRNFGDRPVALPLALGFAADFSDIFEIRGKRRQQPGRRLPDEVEGNVVRLSYRGRDDILRTTCLSFAPAPDRLQSDEARYELALAPGAEATIEIEIRLSRRSVADRAEKAPMDGARRSGVPAAIGARQRTTGTAIETSDTSFNGWLARSRSDLDMLVTETQAGPYPYGGIPWFCTSFGRDGLITALQCLWLDPDLAKGVLNFLAATQATETDPMRDAQPGKILHEARNGEMANLGEVPFGRYYGSVDATPLFLMLAGAYWARTGDLDFIRSILPNLEAALGWIERHGDLDGDGFVEYSRVSPIGLVNQGWKDSQDAVFHADGSLAAPPIALCEVQGYVYAALRAFAALAGALGEADRAETLTRRAAVLRERFEEAFWCEDLSTYALALDGDKRPCRVRASNAGHALFTGIAGEAHGGRAAETLMSPAFFSGWGIRTVAEGEARYNPISYHNGSVWPHDTALVAMGLVRYGRKEAALRLLTATFEAAQAFDLNRLPELFCGFPRRPNVAPGRYPVACIPQAWACASAFSMLGACLGVSFDAAARRIRFHRPILPAFVDRLTIRGLSLRDATVDLRFERNTSGSLSVAVLRRTGDVEIGVTE